MGGEPFMTGLAKKTFLVTGSGKGLGGSLAIEAAKHGAQVVLHYNSSVKSAQKVLEQVRAYGVPAILVQADLSTPDGPAQLYAKAQEAFGGVDVLINNAAAQYNLPFPSYDEQHLRRLLYTNVGGYLLMAQAVLPYMRAAGFGRIINISSIHAKRPTTFDPAYSISKGSIKMFTREMALACGGTDITVNAIELGYVEIGVKSGNPREVLTAECTALEPLFRLKKTFAWDRRIMPEDLGPAVMFLASEQAKYINGASLRIDDAAMLL